MIEVSVIVPFKNAQETLPACLGSLASQTHRRFEIILVDNGSTDESKALAEGFWAAHRSALPVAVLSEERPGASAARNRGAAEARGRFLAFIDADCIADRRWLEQVLPPFQDEAVGAVAGNIVGAPAGGAWQRFHGLFTLQGRKQDQLLEQFTLTAGGFPSANLAVRKALFEQIGGFDTSIPSFGEDYDLCARIYAAGHAIKAIASGLVQHVHRNSAGATWRQAFGFGTAHPRLMARHLRRQLIVEIGPWRLHKTRVPIGGWLDLGSADKKLLGLLLLSMVQPICLWSVPLYGAYLAALVRRRAARCRQPVGSAAALEMAAMLVFKSAAITAGRLLGSVKHGVICL